jgi:hypothetical protein
MKAVHEWIRRGYDPARYGLRSSREFGHTLIKRPKILIFAPWLVNNPKIGEISPGLYSLGMLSGNMGAVCCDGMCRLYDA